MGRQRNCETYFLFETVTLPAAPEVCIEEPFIEVPLMDVPFMENSFMEEPFIERPFIEEPFIELPSIEEGLVRLDISPMSWAFIAARPRESP